MKIHNKFIKVRKLHSEKKIWEAKMSVIPGMMAPEFQGMSIQSGTFSDCSLSTLLSKKSWALLFFFPLDFGHIAASELLEIEKIRKKLLGLGCRF